MTNFLYYIHIVGGGGGGTGVPWYLISSILSLISHYSCISWISCFHIICRTVLHWIDNEILDARLGKHFIPTKRFPLGHHWHTRTPCGIPDYSHVFLNYAITIATVVEYYLRRLTFPCVQSDKVLYISLYINWFNYVAFVGRWNSDLAAPCLFTLNH